MWRNNSGANSMIWPSTCAPISGGEPLSSTLPVSRTAAWSACANAIPGLLTTPAPARIILTGSQSERPMLEEIAQGITSPPLLMTDMTTGQMAALLQRAKLVLGVDNGPLHLAVAQG